MCVGCCILNVCVLSVTCGSNVMLRIFGCLLMGNLGNLILFICSFRLQLYSAGSRVKGGWM